MFDMIGLPEICLESTTNKESRINPPRTATLVTFIVTMVWPSHFYNLDCHIVETHLVTLARPWPRPQEWTGWFCSLFCFLCSGGSTDDCLISLQGQPIKSYLAYSKGQSDYTMRIKWWSLRLLLSVFNDRLYRWGDFVWSHDERLPIIKSPIKDSEKFNDVSRRRLGKMTRCYHGYYGGSL